MEVCDADDPAASVFPETDACILSAVAALSDQVPAHSFKVSSVPCLQCIFDTLVAVCDADNPAASQLSEADACSLRRMPVV